MIFLVWMRHGWGSLESLLCFAWVKKNLMKRYSVAWVAFFDWGLGRGKVPITAYGSARLRMGMGMAWHGLFTPNSLIAASKPFLSFYCIVMVIVTDKAIDQSINR